MQEYSNSQVCMEEIKFLTTKVPYLIHHIRMSVHVLVAACCMAARHGP